MEASDTTTATTTTSLPLFFSPSTSPTSSPPPPTIVVSPCAACKILRRRCIDKCVLAPYFPPTEPLKFTTAHRVFGASNIIKFLQDLPESQRADAVSSMVYEANARIRDPVYGCAGAICHLQKQVNELQTQLAQAQAELINMQTQQANLMTIICMEMAHFQQPQLDNGYLATNPYTANTDNVSFLDNSDSDSNNNINNPDSLWEPLWT